MRKQSPNPINEFRYTITFKTNWVQHTQLQDITTQIGKSFSETCRDIFDSGLDAWTQNRQEFVYKPELKLFHALKEVRKREGIQQVLGELKGKLPQEEFLEQCKAFGEDPKDYDGVLPPPKQNSKAEHCRTFLRALFTDRPEGLPATRVLEISKAEGFGENLTRDVARELGLNQIIKIIEETRMSFWVPTIE